MNRQSNINKLYPIDKEVIQFVKYGHIQRGDNHYQFYFDFERLTEYWRENKEEDGKKLIGIEKWAEDCGKEVDSGAYNIVISPLQKTNSEFLKIIIEKAFGSNLHLLHINITDTGKENIRTKYSYITSNIKDIIGAGYEIKFYYVDDSICTGNAVARAYKFLQTLYSQAGKGINEFKFEKVFLLVNRSSYETALTWVKDPNKDWFGFINLRVPSYNTHSNTCPGCRVMDRYELLRKRSAISELIDYFGDRAEKQKPRSPQEYDLWKNNEILNNSAYFKILLFNGDLIKEEIKKKIEDFCKLNLDRLNKVSIKEFIDYVKNGHEQDYNEKKYEDEIKKIINEIIAKEDFRRLQTMDNAYSCLIYNRGSQEELSKIILNLLSNCFEKQEYEAIQEFCSYIKVISRDYLAKNYEVKKAVLNVLINLFDGLVSFEQITDGKLKNIIERIGEVPVSLQYNVMKLIIRRLAIMRSDYIIYPGNIIKIVRAYGELKEKNESEADIKRFAPLPDDDTVIVDYVASIKTATMEENDDGMCEKLLDTISGLEKFLQKAQKVLGSRFLEEKKEKIKESANTILRIKNNLIVENNRIFYDLMEELSNRITNFDDDITSDWKYEGYIGEGSLKNRRTKINELCNDACTLIDECKEGNLYQNPLSSFVRFYKKALLSGDNDIPYAERKKIAEMINGFNILRFLTEPEYKKERHSKFDSLPYIYEDLCLSLKNMTGAISSYIVYIKEGEASQLVSRSGYVIDKKADKNDAYPLDEKVDEFCALNIGSSEFDLLIKQFDGGAIRLEERKNSEIELKAGNEQLISGVKIINTNQKRKIDRENNKESEDYSHRFMLFKIPVKQGSENEKDKRKFFIILELEKENIKDKTNEYLKIAVRVLFLRNRLWEALSKHYSALLNFRFYVNYMCSVDETDDKNVKIMHISDMHLNDDETWASDSDKLKALSEGLKNEKGIDLLAVTGDIVEASADSLTAQRKYKRAANLLFEIAKKLWGVEDENGVLLPHDWKRRIIITTGNHDYAAMNDVRVQTKSRKIETGLPASSTGGTMSKYTYYLEFLSYFLDAPTQRLLKNDLNEVRYYSNIKKNLKLAVGVFNTSSKANALQNNKVSIDNERLELVLKDGGWYDREAHKTYLAIMHHSPHYEVDYFKDKYSPWRHNQIEDFEALYEAYIKELKFRLVDNNLQKTNFAILFDNFEVKYKNNESNKLHRFRSSELNLNMKMLNDIIKEKCDDSNEYVARFKSEQQNLFSTIEKDTDIFKNNCKIIFEKIESNIAVLSGHRHRCKNTKKKNNLPTTYEVDKIFTKEHEVFEKKEVMLYEVVTISEDNSECEINLLKGVNKRWTKYKKIGYKAIIAKYHNYVNNKISKSKRKLGKSNIKSKLYGKRNDK